MTAQTFVAVVIVGFVVLVVGGAACLIGFGLMRPGRRSGLFGGNLSQTFRTGPALATRTARPVLDLGGNRHRSEPGKARG